jgi:hypothetical protein
MAGAFAARRGLTGVEIMMVRDRCFLGLCRQAGEVDRAVPPVLFAGIVRVRRVRMRARSPVGIGGGGRSSIGHHGAA